MSSIVSAQSAICWRSEVPALGAFKVAAAAIQVFLAGETSNRIGRFESVAAATLKAPIGQITQELLAQIVYPRPVEHTPDRIHADAGSSERRTGEISSGTHYDVNLRTWPGARSCAYTSFPNVPESQTCWCAGYGPPAYADSRSTTRRARTGGRETDFVYLGPLISHSASIGAFSWWGFNARWRSIIKPVGGRRRPSTFSGTASRAWLRVVPFQCRATGPRKAKGSDEAHGVVAR
ncbi:hypothetical protein EDB84DRAFT_1597199 [Lactarius hengduanensis]|nr:hypothetical protein EDB84DRAFT_1597199 [Lactarius hengduanensis]